MLRTIPLKTVTMPNVADPLTWSQLINVVLTSPRQGGVQIDGMRKSMKVLDELDKCTDELKLSEDLWSHLRDQVNTHTWGAPNRVLVDFTDDVANAKKYDPNTPA
jgi:hypothetical protein